MNAVNTLHVSPSQALGKTIVWLLRFVLLLVLYFILFAMSGSLVAPYLPTIPAEPGPVPQMTGLLIVCVATVLVMMAVIHSSRWNGWMGTISIPPPVRCVDVAAPLAQTLSRGLR